MELEHRIKFRANELGFDLAGITTADPIDQSHLDRLQTWLAEGLCGPLHYMHNHIDKRFNPAALLENARSVICVGLRYETLAAQTAGPAKIASYAHYEDYHPFIKERLYALAAFIESRLPKSATWRFKIAVDSVPLAEKALAQRAGLGFIGRNRLLIHPKYGGAILLGELITTLDLAPDRPLQTAGCGACDRCIRACPTGALRPDGLLDARRCISGLTQYDSTDPKFPQPPSDWLFGCDECLLACPYTQNAPPPSPVFRADLTRKKINPRDILSWDQTTFHNFFGDSCIRRIGLEKLQNNARHCLRAGRAEENSGN
jgi:epoxyqueuosine reductase